MRRGDKYYEEQDNDMPGLPVQMTILDIVESVAAVFAFALLLTYGVDPLLSAVGRWLSW